MINTVELKTFGKYIVVNVKTNQSLRVLGKKYQKSWWVINLLFEPSLGL